jgi:hypothetical protein
MLAETSSLTAEDSNVPANLNSIALAVMNDKLSMESAN